MTTRLTLPRSLALVAVAAAIPLAACGDDDEKTASKTPAKLTITETDAGKKVNVTIAGAKTPGATDITFTNNGKKPHSAQLIATTGNRTEADVEKAFAAVSSGKAAPKWFFAAGGVGTTAPGATTKASVVLLPGTYWVIDDEDEANLKNGGLNQLPIAGDKNEGKLPTGATVTAKDYSFTASGLRAGANTVVFANTGKEWHHLIAAPMNKGATIDDVKKFATSEGEPQGPPPVDFENGVGTAVIDGGQAQVAELEQANDPARAALVEALRSQLGVLRRCERQLQAFYDQMEQILVELDTIRGNLVSASASTDSASQKQLADDVRGLREEVGALADGHEEAYAERPDQ